MADGAGVTGEAVGATGEEVVGVVATGRPVGVAGGVVGAMGGDGRMRMAGCELYASMDGRWLGDGGGAVASESSDVHDLTGVPVVSIEVMSTSSDSL